MTAKEIFVLRKQGKKEEAYEAARQLFAVDKGPFAASAMFWTASDMLQIHVKEGRMSEAQKILMAIERILPGIPDQEGWVSEAYHKDCDLLQRGNNRIGRGDGVAQKKKMGTWGEEIAAMFLRDRGYVILERDWHSGHRDIDIIAQQGDCLVFVEVKTRRTSDFGSPISAVNYSKQKNLRMSINHYLKYRRLDMNWRFDVITVVGHSGEDPQVEHIEDFQLAIR